MNPEQKIFKKVMKKRQVAAKKRRKKRITNEHYKVFWDGYYKKFLNPNG